MCVFKGQDVILVDRFEVVLDDDDIIDMTILVDQDIDMWILTRQVIL